MDALPLVVVNGASGFVGSHVVKQLLESGLFRVRATVRDANNQNKTQFLKALDHKHELEIVSADLRDADSFKSAVAGATYVIHTAAALALASSNPQRDIIDNNLNSVQHVLLACQSEASKGNLKRVVFTSSIAAIADRDKPNGYTYTECDDNVSCSASDDPYSYSKFQAEQVVNDYMKSVSEQDRFSAVFVNPGAIYGPILAPHHAQGSVMIVSDMMAGKLPMCPQFAFAAVDVRDVARAIIHAMQHEELTGRFICVESTYSFKELSLMCKEMFPQYPWPTKKLWNAIMYLTSIFDRRLTWSFCRHNLSRRCFFSSEKIKGEMAFEYLPMQQTTLRDTCEALLEQGIVGRK